MGYSTLYVRLLSLPCGTQPNWKAAQAQLKEYIAYGEGHGS